jgi:tRNA threonylcarbamoyladenosine biosynthesis protein TsaE
VAIILKITLNNEAETQQFAKTLAQNAIAPLVIYLQGDLGVGKTTFAQSFIQFFGFDKVKSPTYSLVESYQNQAISIHHFDCYRLSDPEELEYIGIREYLKDNHIQLIEWAEMGKGMLAPADLTIKLSGDNETRQLTLTDHSDTGKKLLHLIKIS